jgi:cell wall-associated NlpC family hydrolase
MTWRDKVIEEAKTWKGTPHRNGARVKGAGVDCGQILIAVYESAGVLAKGSCDPGYYPADFAMHRGEENYLGWIEKYCDQIDLETDAPQPGDVALFQFGRVISHAGIVTTWPRILHSYVGLGVIESDIKEAILCDKKGASRLKGVWRPRGGRKNGRTIRRRVDNS